ncbi:MAG: Flp pilus assembly protein CpaB [Acidimicrobiia bacterium]|nr:Flp pilus assembly protein CpaB [Acidimicrobiia bacterium]
MLRRSPRAALLWAGAAVVGLATARMAAQDLAALHRQARALGDPREIVVARHDLALGSTVDPEDLAVRRLHASEVPDGALLDPRDAVGRVVAVPVLRGGTVLARHLTPAERSGLDGIVPEGMRAVRVVATDTLRPDRGATVDVLVTLDPSLVGEGVEPTLVAARAALVVQVDAGGADSLSADAGPGTRLGVTLLVTTDEATRLAYASANGVLALALTPPEDACCRTSFSGSSRG